MSEERSGYLAYLLRMWCVEVEGRPHWRASLELPSSGERFVFVSLEATFDFLRERTDELSAVSPAPLPDSGQRATKRAVGYLHSKVPNDPAGRQCGGTLHPFRFRRFRPAVWAQAFAAILLILVMGATSVLYAADGAVPGGLLYNIDLTWESVRLSLTHRPEAAFELWLSIAEERLSEAETLSSKGRDSNFWLALGYYGKAVASLAQSFGAVEQPVQASLPVLYDQTFLAHERRLAVLLNQGDGSGGCVGADLLSVARGLADQYDVPYHEVLAWFCQCGYSFGEIVLALETGHTTGTPVDELLARKALLGGWGQVWQELGLAGSGHDLGPPDEARPSDDARPPDDAGSADDRGPLDDTRPPDVDGSSDDAGPPDDPCPPAADGPLDDGWTPDDAGSPDADGPSGNASPLDDTSPPDGEGPTEQEAPPGNMEPPQDSGPSDDDGPAEGAGPPDDTSPPEDSGSPNDGGSPDSPGMPDGVAPPRENAFWMTRCLRVA